MGPSLPRGPPCCSRLHKAAPQQAASQPVTLSLQAHRPRRVVINAFLFNASTTSSSNNHGAGKNGSRESISNRLSELRVRSEDEDRALLSQREEHGADDDVSSSHEGDPESRLRRTMGPWPADAYDQDSDDPSQGPALAGGQGGPVTARSLRYMVSDPKPEIKLLHRFKPGHGPRDSEFWRSFMDKCRLAWGVFFPPSPETIRRQNSLTQWAGGLGRFLAPRSAVSAPEGQTVNGLSAKQVVLSRLQMVLIADRCGVSPEHLLEMKAQTLTALAEYMGKDLQEDVAQLEVQVSALKPNGERITMTIGFTDMLGDDQLRDPMQYDYEFEDDDDYFMPEDDSGRIADIAEAPTAGLKAARVAAKPVSGTAAAGKDEP